MKHLIITIPLGIALGVGLIAHAAHGEELIQFEDCESYSKIQSEYIGRLKEQSRREGAIILNLRDELEGEKNEALYRQAALFEALAESNNRFKKMEKRFLRVIKRLKKNKR
jgi:hypothetical protein